MKKIALKILAIVLFTSAAYADEIYLGQPGYGGNGCPQGTASATVSPDQKSLSIIFDQFVAEAGGMTGKSMDRKTCSIAVPVHVPQGYSISIIAVDYRGFNSLPTGAYSRFTSEYFFAGQRGPMFSRDFYGQLENEYLFKNTLGVVGMVWSACGADVNLRVNTSMMVRTNRMRAQAMATVDSADFNAGLVYHIQWKKCY
ncbi:MAG: hypothetical protein A2381_06255 [Bdellovibrionales bacterium RIFOXYB1_FULL_37_110]|nr:MAG: hypothetical protein A2417_02530 [Bdellovibrionales bacterium RIFOXYC1_FULL_37_79]OFZ60107.1 MAG: hypothetical protein A2381_06255 [Bdellovibrionales bacterium RIFOXYB1_FULL_37_110]OFZ63430.1 MAG: hypothetical protein A2577_00030 [Bdellovibrionales bacterium RIFOXYD1_FULL_36_51]